MAVKKKVCKECGRLVTENICKVCNSNKLLDKYKGNVIVVNAKESIVAKKLNIKDNGNFALKY